MGFVGFIDLQWIGNDRIEADLLEGARAQVEAAFGVPARISEAAERPPDTFDPKRGQYSSTEILRWLLRHVPPGARKVIAITDGDLFIPVLTFVFGEAQLGGPCAVVSIARLQVEPGGIAAPKQLLRARFIKECIHELGHTFGLSHCASIHCVMSRSNTLREVDAKAWNPCRECRHLLRELERARGEEA